jgi:hypothetical protein
MLRLTLTLSNRNTFHTTPCFQSQRPYEGNSFPRTIATDNPIPDSRQIPHCAFRYRTLLVSLSRARVTPRNLGAAVGPLTMLWDHPGAREPPTSHKKERAGEGGLGASVVGCKGVADRECSLLVLGNMPKAFRLCVWSCPGRKRGQGM